MKLTKPHVWIAVFSTIGVVSVAVVDMQRNSPGELTAVHATQTELNGSFGCRNCHGGLGEGMTSACLECHEEIGEQVAAGAGLHGRLGPSEAARCGACHSEHHGASFQTVNAQSFARAGVPDAATFDHELVGYAMEGAHLELACSECHANAEVRILPEGQQRFLGLVQDCKSCHEDPHEGQLAAASCADCHEQSAFDALHYADHRELPLEGGHAGLDCRTCHAAGEPFALEVLLGPGAKPEPRTCLACHEPAHEQPFLAGIARFFETSAGATCASCHAPEHATFREDALTLTPRQHAAAGFALQIPHANLACAECHDPALASFAERYPGRAADACEACHADAHEGFFAEVVAQGAAVAQLGAPGCAACHGGTSFSEIAPGRFDHGASTGFALAGAHLESRCESCHPSAAEPDAFGRTFGRTAERFGAPPSDDSAGRATCSRCHADAHSGGFDRPRMPKDVDGRAGCARCHAETSFRALPFGFDHKLWTGFALRDRHAAVDCTACHAPLAETLDNGRSWDRALGRACADCHADPHAGQFEEAGKSDCARCHQSAASFAELVFDHQTDSRFPLDATHAELACAQCHRADAQAFAGGLPRGPVRYKPLGTTCAACHGSQEGPLLRRKGRKQ